MTLELPPPAAPWAPWLAELVPDLRPAFLEAVLSLERALGPLPPLPDPGAVEPTGLDGLRRRGPYERLLLSEWVLADELPDEFLRRAATGEHLFHELSRVVPKRGRRCLVWVDTGPEQLGGPRLVQLALLVVFARRAERAGAELTWGSLQDRLPRGPGAFREFPALRRTASATREDVAACLALTAPLAPTDEVFLVGGDSIRTLATGQPTVELSEPVTGAADTVRVVVRRRGASPVTRDLPLPAPALRTRWIRDPFRALPAPRAPVPTPARSRAGSGPFGPLRPFLRFSADGNRILAVEAETDAALAFRLPEGDAGAKAPVRVASYRAGSRLVALGWCAGRLHAWFHADGSTPEWHLPVTRPEGFEPPPPGLDPGDLVFWRERGSLVGWVWTPDLRLQRWGAGAGPPISACLGIARRDGRPYWWERRADATVTHDLRTPAQRESPRAADQVVVGAAGPGAGHVLLVSGQRVWNASDELDTLPTELPAGARVVGAPMSWQGGSWKRGILFLRGDELWVRWYHPSQPDVLVTAGVTAAAGGTLHYSPLVAWVEAPSTLVVWDLGASQERVRWTAA